MMGRGKGSAKHPTMRRIPSHNKALLSPKCEADGGREAILTEHLCSFRCPRPPFPFSYSLSFGFLHIAFSSLFLLSCPSCSFSLSFPGFLFHFFQFPHWLHVQFFIYVFCLYPPLLQWTPPVLWLHFYPIQLIPKLISPALTCSHGSGLHYKLPSKCHHHGVPQAQ